MRNILVAFLYCLISAHLPAQVVQQVVTAGISVPAGSTTPVLDTSARGTYCSPTCTSNTTNTTITPTAGTLMVVDMIWCVGSSCPNSAGCAATDVSAPTGGGNTFVQAFVSQLGQPGPNNRVCLAQYYVVSTLAGTYSITANWGVTVNFGEVEVSTWKNMAASSPFDATGATSGTATGTQSVTTTGNLAQSNELTIGWGAENTGAMTAGAGWNQINSGSFAGQAVEQWLVQGTSGSTASSPFGVGGAAQAYFLTMGTYKHL